jgi:hypothetical protein
MSIATPLTMGKLPAESTSFVGRRKLLAEVKAAFADTRLLTLVGAGGVGKTRLALRAAADLRRTVRHGVWFIDLAGLEDPHLVAKAVITSLGLMDQSGEWPTSLLVAHLAPREALLVLDNCEHLLDAIAVLADVVLKEAAGVRLLATSRWASPVSACFRCHRSPCRQRWAPALRKGLRSQRRRPFSSHGPQMPVSHWRTPTAPGPWCSISAAAWTACHWRSNWRPSD